MVPRKPSQADHGDQVPLPKVYLMDMNARLWFPGLSEKLIPADGMNLTLHSNILVEPCEIGTGIFRNLKTELGLTRLGSGRRGHLASKLTMPFNDAMG
jgi:hypothetical protein